MIRGIIFPTIGRADEGTEDPADDPQGPWPQCGRVSPKDDARRRTDRASGL